ncbi:class I SAM-dependent methyltransferase [Rhodococcus sp. 14-1411-2a]|uniref:class I SAM-dependent methyltransferase n=1 Tax=Rhodococcus sp. 14-1411-2a TaxID=2023151 RepID=UPI000B9C706E|nr:class I SAM-dependent methyltransferase [Rhodococcus sp. 14-1411-2a]OZF45364.1 hypothetical protein CH291_17890 [Rhodococcus sp. 14-1411-2a]
MNKERHNQARETFSLRAGGYNLESTWVTSVDLISPLFTGLDSGLDVLDVCSGTGTVAQVGTDLGHSLTAIDLSPEMVSLNHIQKRLVASGSALPFVDCAFDHITCRQGLHYLDLINAMAEFFRVCRTSVGIGSIVMNKENDRKFWQEYFKLASPGRLHVFAPGEIALIARSAGFESVSVTYCTSTADILGPVQHLNRREKKEIELMFSSREIRRNYNVRLKNDILFYDLIWEFTRLTKRVD